MLDITYIPKISENKQSNEMVCESDFFYQAFWRSMGYVTDHGPPHHRLPMALNIKLSFDRNVIKHKRSMIPTQT